MLGKSKYMLMTLISLLVNNMVYILYYLINKEIFKINKYLIIHKTIFN